MQDIQHTGSRPRIPSSHSTATDTSEKLANLEQFSGYRPNALATMARRPGLLDAVLQMVNTILRQDGRLPESLRFLLACEAARQAGCLYTATHLAHAAHLTGASWERIDWLASPEPSALFSDAEWALLALARKLGSPQEKDAAWEAARAHWDNDALAEAVSAVAIAGWFTGWNMLVETELEAEPAIAIGHVHWLKAMSA